MPAFDKTKIQGLVGTINDPPSHAAKGKALEQLACHIFGCIPGIVITSVNELNTFATEEIDVACRNLQDSAGLLSLNPFFIVECKGWDAPVNSEQVAWFLTKIEHRATDFGVLIAANGITGVPEHLTAARFQVAVALAAKKIKMVIITQAEIEALDSGEQLAKLIIEKVTQLHATGGKCY